MILQEGLSSDDLLLVPQYSDIRSRKEINIGGQLHQMYLKLPIISSPMDTVTETEMAESMANHGGLGIIHRYCSIEQQVQMIKNLKDVYVGAAIGVVGDFKERAQELNKLGVNIICIDVAHGDHILVKEAIEIVKKIDDSISIMAGNVATGDGFIRLAQWGADSIRVGIGGGSICSTRLNTGFGVPNMSAIFDCVNKAYSYSSTHYPNKLPKIPSLVVDGGIRNAGDIVKALAAGADFVMCGSLLAGTEESPGNLILSNGKLSKEYRGMASRKAQTSFKGSSSAPEGIDTMIPFKGKVGDILTDLDGNIRSGFSYAGARNIEELRSKAQFIKQTSAGQHESFTHILSR